MKKMKPSERRRNRTVMILLSLLLIIVVYAFIDALMLSICMNYGKSAITLVECSLATGFGMLFGMLASALLIMTNQASRSGGPGSWSQVVMGRIGLFAFSVVPAAGAFASLVGAEKYSLEYWMSIGMFLGLAVGFVCAIVIIPRK